MISDELAELAVDLGRQFPTLKPAEAVDMARIAGHFAVLAKRAAFIPDAAKWVDASFNIRRRALKRLERFNIALINVHVTREQPYIKITT